MLVGQPSKLCGSNDLVCDSHTLPSEQIGKLLPARNGQFIGTI